MRYVGAGVLLICAACMAWRLVADAAELFGKNYEPPPVIGAAATLTSIVVIGFLVFSMVTTK